MSKMTDKERRFCLEYLLDYNQTRSAIAAGYSKKTAATTATKIMKRAHIKAFLGKHEKESQDKFEVDRDTILRHLVAGATRDGKDFVDAKGRLILESQNIKDLPNSITSTINSIKQRKKRYRDQDTGEMIEVIETEVKLVDKAKLLEMCMKHKGLFAPTEVHNTNHNIDWDKLAAGTPILEDDPIEAIIIKERNKGENE